MKEWVFERLHEASTWRGIMLILTATTGLTLSTTEQQLITNLGLELVGILGVVTKDAKGA